MHGILFYSIIYLGAMNVVGLALFGMDKWKARRGRWRVSEATLLTVAALGGSVGAWAGMFLFRHKTLHAKFRYGIPAIIAAQVLLAVFIFRRLSPN